MLKQEELYFALKDSKFASALWFDSVFPKSARHFISKTLNICIIFALAAILLIFFIPKLAVFPAIPFFSKISFLGNDVWLEKTVDFLFLLLFFKIIFFSLESFYRSRSDVALDGYLSFGAASLLAKTFFKYWIISSAHILRIFPMTDIGKFTLIHLGISPEDFLKLFEGNATAISSGQNSKQLNTTGIKSVSDIFMAILENNNEAAKLFFDLKIKKEDLRGALEWAEDYFLKTAYASAWWKEGNLARIRGVAKDWAFGATYLLERFSRIFSHGHFVARQHLLHFTGHQKQIEEMEAALSRQAQANVLIVGEPGVGKRTVVAGLDDMIKTGKIRPELEYKILVELLVPTLVASAKTKGELENLIIRVFNDAVKAGNIILLIDNFSQFINSAASLGVSLIQILGPYLESKNLQIIAVENSSAFKKFLEPDSAIMRFFETIRIEEPLEGELLKILEDVALELEVETGLIIPYQTVQEAIKASNNYLTEGVLPERAIDILETVSSRVSGAGKNIVLPEDISDFVSEKTKMPLGVLKVEEREKLMLFEEVLHKRVVDQEEAILTISAAVKRIRVGIQTAKKPLASFLFLGPTGVGKTETAKTLAEVYFGNEEAMTRFDMSEYQNENGMERLIGSFEKGEPGIMSSKLREKPYGLLLLDEFEKCHIKVRDLFLQILDEGFFTDAFGKKVIMRNNIIIATSNAASQLIWEMGKKGIDPSALKEKVIDEIQKEGIFKPELLNRFDTIVVFRSLAFEHLKAIAEIMLGKLKKRLFEEKEIDLAVNDILIEKVAEIGYDPLFGARPMQRAIQEKVEKKIAEWIISGKVDRGAKIEFTAEDLANM